MEYVCGPFDGDPELEEEFNVEQILKTIDERPMRSSSPTAEATDSKPVKSEFESQDEH